MPVRAYDHTTLKSARKAAGLSIRKASEAVGVSDYTICCHERGEHPPKATTLTRYADAYGVDLLAFFTSEGEAA